MLARIWKTKKKGWTTLKAGILKKNVTLSSQKVSVTLSPPLLTLWKEQKNHKKRRT